MKLNTEWNLGGAGDEIYAELIDAHAGLTEVESRRLDLRLILLLANQVGDEVAIREALRLARAGLGSSGQ
jgi:Protein of unknown function (DUF2783)